jgi:2-polyprenyl-3-methyl-5-hydroxy-6-metoxy-1,4-benzoquinol methylase
MRDDWRDALRYRVAPQLPVEEFERFQGCSMLPSSPAGTWTRRSGAFGLQSGHLLLDLACGQGAPGLWLAHQSGCDLVGIDFAEAGLRVTGDDAGRACSSSRVRTGERHAIGTPGAYLTQSSI